MDVFSGIPFHSLNPDFLKKPFGCAMKDVPEAFLAVSGCLSLCFGGTKQVLCAIANQFISMKHEIVHLGVLY